jgi:hypothetical protein
MDRWTRALAAGMTLTTAALLIGCEDTPLTPGEGWTMDVVAQPSVVTLEAGEATATLIATVANDTGVPQSGVSVIFSNAGGELASGSAGVETDGAGRAVDTLTIRDADPDSIEVTASSGALTDTVTVAKSTSTVDNPPVADITATPPTEQVSGQTVVFDGSGSDDPDPGDVITMYRWRITSTNPDPGPERTYEGPGRASIGFPSSGVPAFVNVQNLTVELSVTDDPAAPFRFDHGLPVSYRASITIPYKIVTTSCASNAKPVATIAGADTQTKTGNGQPTVDFQLDGSLSTDAETAIGSYTWSCGNGSAPPPSQPVVTCTYPVDSVTRSYTATLVVRDLGNGAGQCIQTSTQDSVSIVVIP